MPRRILHIVPAAARWLGLATLLALAACGEPEHAQGGPVAPEAPLPGPQQAGGSVTDMPAAPGPGEVPLSGSPPPPLPPPEQLPADGNFGLPPLEQNPETGLAAPGTAGVAVPPTPATSVSEDPRDVLRGYYAAINARDFATAQAAWSDGQAAAQTSAQFAATFAGTTSVELTVGEPRPVEGAAGSVYVEVPVTVTSTRADGSVQYQAGRYTLRRSQVDGATATQRAWRIAAMDLRDAVR